MKINGRKIEKHIVYVVLPRGDDEDLVIICQAVTDYSEFDKLCPFPVAPKMLVKGGQKIEDVTDPAYVKQVNDWSSRKMAWMALESLRPSNIEWDNVIMNDASTWSNWQKDFLSSGLSDTECSRILAGIVDANALNEQKLEEARKRFLAGHLGERQSPSSQTVVQPPTPSTELVSVSDSSPQV